MDHELRTFLLQIGFVNSVADPSLFIYKHEKVIIYLLVYVDDIIITGSSSKLVEDIITRLSNRFSLKDLGTLSYFLGVECQKHPRGLFLNQQKYVTDLLQKVHMMECKSISTPMCTTTSL